MAGLSAVKFDGGVGLHGKSITIPVVLDALRSRRLLFPPGSKSTGGTREPLKCALDYGVIRENVSGSTLLQSSVCKVNSAGDNTEPLRGFSVEIDLIVSVH